MPGTDQHDRVGQCNRQTPTTNAFIVLSTRDPASTAYSYRFVEGSEKGSGMAVWTSREVVSRGDPKSTLFTTRVRFTALRSVIVGRYTNVIRSLQCNEFRYLLCVSSRSQSAPSQSVRHSPSVSVRSSQSVRHSPSVA
jgi:hypothetical protein